MQILRSLTLITCLTGAMIAAPAAFAQKDQPKGQLLPAADKDRAWVAEQKAKYPTALCLVSDEKLGEMGKPVDFVYRVEGKPDRLVSFCCKDCVKDFKKDPEKYLKTLDETAAKKDHAADSEHHHH